MPRKLAKDIIGKSLNSPNELTSNNKPPKDKKNDKECQECEGTRGNSRRYVLNERLISSV